jgi:hypothetical protein
MLTSNPDIAPSPVDPINPTPNPTPNPDPDQPTTVTFDPQTKVILEAGTASLILPELIYM